MQDIRNIAIIAHVDHGKTTLVDKMMLAGLGNDRSFRIKECTLDTNWRSEARIIRFNNEFFTAACQTLNRRYFCVIGNSLEFSITQKGTFFFKFILKSASQLNF